MKSLKAGLVLGIDPGTQTGWALAGKVNAPPGLKSYYKGTIINSGTVSFSDVANKGFGAMFIAFRKFLSGIQRDRGPLAGIAYELPFLRGPIPSRILWGMAAHMQERAAAWHCRILVVSPSALKKFATGSGKSKKPEMIAAAQKYSADALFAETENCEMSEHEADAIHIAMWAVSELAKQ